MQNRLESQQAFGESKDYPTAAWDHVDAMQTDSDRARGREFLESLHSSIVEYNQKEQKGI